MARFRIEIVANSLPDLDEALRERLSLGLAKIAKDIEADAKSRAPVRTGALKNSIQARRVRQLAQEVNVGVDYGAFVEFGTVRMSPRPYLTPAVEAKRNTFERLLANVTEEALRAQEV